MTAQTSNQVILNEEKFNLIGFTDEGLIKPQDFGIIPIGISSFCWRGYVTTYKIDSHSNFLLHELCVSVNSENKIEKINDIPFKRSTLKSKRKVFNQIYEELNLPVEYSGYILIGKEFIQELYVHMGFHPAWKFKVVVELEIELGKVITIRDFSEKIMKYRMYLKEKNMNKRHEEFETDHEKEEWIERTFDQKYKK